MDFHKTIVAMFELPYSISNDPNFQFGAGKGALRRTFSQSRSRQPSQNQTFTGTVIQRCLKGNVGLQNAIESSPLLSNKKIYVGSLGCPSESTYSADEIDKELIKNTCVDVGLTSVEYEGHYEKFCKLVRFKTIIKYDFQVLWKTFHHQVLDYIKVYPDLEKNWEYYVSVNKKFAMKIYEIYSPGDLIWIHDYHLMLVPSLLREMLPDATIGFFFHIPFPSSEIFRCLHVRLELLEGVLGADLIGFQTYSYLRHFLMTCTRLMGAESSPNGIHLENRTVGVGIFPMGLDIAHMNTKRNDTEVHSLVNSLREKYHGKLILVGRDKCDYIKGVRQKLLGFERFLEQNPQFADKVVLLQVTTPTTEDAEKEVADACIISPLRDGMNLTSHEFVACQEINHSPLILSEFAGTYGTCGAAIKINPWDTQEVADAIKEAFTMNDEEKYQRWKELYAQISSNSGDAYVSKFLSDLLRVSSEFRMSSIPILPLNLLYQSYEKSNRRLLLIDHEGTLVSLQRPRKSTIKRENKQNIQLLKRLCQDEKNLVYIMSSKRKEDLSEYLIPNLGLCAENGMFIKNSDSDEWRRAVEEPDLSWKPQTLEIFEYYADRTPGSYIEERETSVSWNFGTADISFASWQANELQAHVESTVCRNHAIRVLPKKKSIVIFPIDVNKGIATQKIMEYHDWQDYNQSDLVVAIGDDRVDEFMFDYLLKKGAGCGLKDDSPRKVVTCVVGRKASNASWYVAGPSEVRAVLEYLGKKVPNADAFWTEVDQYKIIFAVLLCL